MNYSSLIVPAAENIAKKIGCGVDTAAEYIESVIFNTEFDLYSFIKMILN
ncbi:MAG: hypothetical protein IJI14_10430 [Anaerolineaceae bacterium]|nr:hypothetical protein [Anaerolineaceae bacterium]